VYRVIRVYEQVEEMVASYSDIENENVINEAQERFLRQPINSFVGMPDILAFSMFKRAQFIELDELNDILSSGVIFESIHVYGAFGFSEEDEITVKEIERLDEDTFVVAFTGLYLYNLYSKGE